MSTFMLMGFATLVFLVLLLLGKTLTAIELRSLERDFRQNQARISELEEDLETSRRKYLIALKAEGVAKHKTSQLRTRLTSLRQQMEHIQATRAQQAAQKDREKGQKLEGLVMHLLGGPSVRKDSQFKRVMKVIDQLVDLEGKGNSEDLFEAIQKKVKEMGREGLLRAAEKGSISLPVETPVSETLETKSEAEDPGEPPVQAAPPATEVKPQKKQAAEPDRSETEPDTSTTEERSAPNARRDRIRDAIVRKGR